MVSQCLLLSPHFSLSLSLMVIVFSHLREILGWGSLLSLRSSVCEKFIDVKACISGAKQRVHGQLVCSLRLSLVALLSICISSLTTRTEAYRTFLGSRGTFGYGPRVSHYLHCIFPTITTFPLCLTTFSFSSSIEWHSNQRSCLASCLCYGCSFAPPPLPFFRILDAEKGMSFVCLPATETVAQKRALARGGCV